VILVVSATAAELRAFVPPADVRVVHCGVGPVEAAAVTAALLARERFAFVVNAGIAGVFRGRGAVGDAFAVSEESMAELGIETRAPLSLPDGLKLETRVEADAGLLRRAQRAGLRAGRGVTVSSITASEATAARLFAEFAADVESMEGFAVLRAAALAGVPAIEVRGISNFVGDRSDSDWDFAAGRRAAVDALTAFFAAAQV
jgi:futalosine hydrolase